ncbi:MAG: AAA family ATPase [Chloroflexi bacterium]|nr:AAA family ATPase [Chloroflexota bacterium]
MAARSASPFAEKEYDDLDRKIDSFLGRLGAIIRVLIILTALLALTYYVLWPNLETWGPYLMFGLYLVFQLFFAVMFMIIQFAALFWFLGRTRIYWIMPGETGVTFKDYKGNPEIIHLAQRVVTLLRGVRGFKEMGGQVHRGMLLVGPPGTGKSYLAQCIASEAGVPFAYASAPSFQSMFFGISNIKVMMLYSKARKMARKYGACIIFMDEIDAIAMSRAGQQGQMGMGGFMGMGGSGLLNELLMQMDPPPTDQGWKQRMLRKIGLRSKKAEMPSVFTMGATNLAQVLDPALLRPGRFDWKITVERPSFQGRMEVLEYYLAKVKRVPDLSVERIATEMITPEGQGYSPVEIKFVVNEAVVHAHFDGRDAINYADIRHAMETREYGLRQQISGRTPEDKRRVAYHEAGHAIAMVRLYTRKRLDRLTLMQYGELRGAEGVAFDKAKEEIHITTREEILTDIQIYLASKAAEQVFLGTETTGMGGDLPGASVRALQYVRCGMGGSLFTINFWGEPTPQERAQAERVMQQQLSLARQLLEQNKPHVHAIVEVLLEKEELLGEEVEEIVARVDRELGRANGVIEAIPTPTPLPIPAAEPVVRYAGARRPSEERREQGVASREAPPADRAPREPQPTSSREPQAPVTWEPKQTETDTPRS